jgi:adenylate cyclase
VFDVLGRRGDVDELRVAIARRFGEGLAGYRQKRFDDARLIFEEIHAAFPDDGPTKAYLKRLADHEYLASLPPDWDGAFVSKEK